MTRDSMNSDTHRRAAAAQEMHAYRSRSLWTLTVVGVILIPALFALFGTFIALFSILVPADDVQIRQGTLIMFIGCAVQLASAITVFAGAVKHKMGAQIGVTAVWLFVSACGIFVFLSHAAVVSSS